MQLTSKEIEDGGWIFLNRAHPIWKVQSYLDNTKPRVNRM